MPRPRKDDSRPAAKQRILDAFCALYMEKPLSAITVKELCARASCNKTSFYYHFQDIFEVLEEIESRCMPQDVPFMVTSLMRDGGFDDDAVRQKLQEYVRVKRGESLDLMCRLLSAQGDPAFARRVKDVMLGRWGEALGFDPDALDPKLRLNMEFLMGGTVSVLADYGDGRIVDLDDLADVVWCHAKRMLPLIRAAAAEGNVTQA